MEPNNIISNVDDYIERFPESVQVLLKQMRALIKKSAPEAKEVISYKMPAYKYFGMVAYYGVRLYGHIQGMVAYFGARKNHIGFYPYPSAIEAFEVELKKYQTSTGTIRFSLKEKLPTDLICKIIEFRVNENLSRKRLKGKA